MKYIMEDNLVKLESRLDISNSEQEYKIQYLIEEIRYQKQLTLVEPSSGNMIGLIGLYDCLLSELEKIRNIEIKEAA